MFLPGIGGHLKVSHMDPRVSFGNESTNLSVQKSFSHFILNHRTLIKNQQEALMGLGIKKGEATKSNTGPGALNHLQVVATFVI